jgi:DNA-binding transcriptional MerR regulator
VIQVQEDTRSYRIGEFAKKVGVSPDFLKYQEEFGVVDPQQSGDSKYRYYAFPQAGRVFASIGYQNLGFTLRDIESIIGSDEAAGILSRLEARAEKITEEMIRSEAYLKAIRRIQDACERENSGAPWYIERVEPFAFLPHSQRHDFLDDDEILSALRQWTEWLPIVSSAQMIDLSTVQNQVGTIPDFSWGLMVDMDFAREREFCMVDSIRVIEAGRFLVYYQCIDLKNEAPRDAALTLRRILEAPLAVVADCRLRVANEVWHRILFSSHENGSRHLHSILYLRLL